MSPTSGIKPPSFDGYAAEYDAALEQGISVSGEGKEYFARGRIVWLAACLSALGKQPKAVLDFGCGTGTATDLFREILATERIVGVDVSAKSLEVARRRHNGADTTFLTLREYAPDESFDLVFCNGVFHHIPVRERADALRYVRKSLRPGGLFAFWENNPWNPGTRLVMSRIPFDRDAVTLSVIEARGLCQDNGLKVLRSDFQFIFPRTLAWLRPLESVLCKAPLGAQYQVLCRKQ